MVKALVDMFQIDPNIPDSERYQIKEYPMTEKQMRENTPKGVIYYREFLRGSLSYRKKLWARIVAKQLKEQQKSQKAGRTHENS
jgi:hypothetical protein